jgi:hypothetical protein
MRFLLFDGRIQVPQQCVIGSLGLGVVTHAERPKSLVNFIGLKGFVIDFYDVSFRVQLNAVVKLQKSKKIACQQC